MKVEFQLYLIKPGSYYDDIEEEWHIEPASSMLSQIATVAIKPSIGCGRPTGPCTPQVEPDTAAWIEIWKANGIVLPIGCEYVEDNDGYTGTKLTFRTFDGHEQIVFVPPKDD